MFLMFPVSAEKKTKSISFDVLEGTLLSISVGGLVLVATVVFIIWQKK